jgi:hypothetical protein
VVFNGEQFGVGDLAGGVGADGFKNERSLSPSLPGIMDPP